MTIFLDVNTLNIDDDTTADHVTFQVTQTGEQSFSVQTFVDTSKDGFGKLNSDTTRNFAIDTLPNWHLSSLKFEGNRLILLGQDGTSEYLSLSQLIPGTADHTAFQKQQLDKEIAQNAGTLGALRKETASSLSLGASGLNSGTMGGMGELLDSPEKPVGSGSLGAQGSVLDDRITAESLDSVGTKGRSSGDSGYGSDSALMGTKGEGGVGISSYDGVVLGALDKSLIDAVMERHTAELRYCYEKELSDNPKLEVKIVCKFVIARDGGVSSAGLQAIQTNQPEVGERVAKAIAARIMQFQFPEPKGGGIVIVSYPFLFAPD